MLRNKISGVTVTVTAYVILIRTDKLLDSTLKEMELEMVVWKAKEN